ncbi:hypothetical protein CARUB_v10027695mg [Capsella rubella]|uniref:F-box domain-containing protein n=1 Tax=Capsella rubella TaxID=81985 RepID=R0EZU1_9BRAS|nr:hypothetical protein CARUB_v10027695mg [Capsella rubella]
MTVEEKIENVEETICKDKISELPEDLLVRILSLVPIKDAVATMFLSKRWFSVWTMIPTLEYKDNDFQHYADFNYNVWNFLDKSMQLHKAPVIDSLCVKIGQLCPTDVDVVKWILVDVPSTLCLPSLRKLHLYCVVYKDDDSIVRFLSGCPVLKCLYVKRKENDNVKKFTIKVPSLLVLDYANLVDGYDDQEHSLVIDTPRLEDFYISASLGDSSSIENMPFLKYACISLFHEKFLRCVSSVSSLRFFLCDEMLVCSSTIKFSRLLKLSICPLESNWFEPLIPLLENSPKLKELWIDSDICGGIALSWNQPISTPGCLSSQLEIFKWNKYGGTEGEEQFLRYVLANSKCLNTAIIDIHVKYNLVMKYKEEVMEKLKDIPRASTTSQLLFT